MKSDFRPLKMRIAEDIKKYIERHPDMKRLPPVRRLSAMFRVSANTVMDAVRLLDEQSIVIRQRGSGVVIAGRASEAAAPDAFRDRRTAAEKVHAHVRDRINDGHFKHNNPLPKTAFLAAQLGVSHHAVTAAYRRLSAANLAHKQGRRWIAGPRKTAAIASPARLPAILLLQSRENFWADMAKRDFFEAFCRSFQSEVESYDVQLMPALFDANSPSSGILPAGAREVTRTIRSLGHRYRGCLICNAIKEQPRLLNWIEQLTGFKQPVVWFDRLKERPDSPFSSAWYVRCHEAEEYAVELALTHLHELRHRHIAFPYYANLGWVQNRLRIMRKLAAQLSFGSLRHSPPHDSLFFTTDLCAQAALLRSGSELGFPCITNALSYIEENWDEMSGAIPAAVQDADDHDRFEHAALCIRSLLEQTAQPSQALVNFPVLPWLVALTPVLCPILADDRITALIAPNDQTAHWYYLWLRASGLRVPRDISLISFDNLWRLQSLPITSVDFGYGYLGFAAFHSIMRDISLSPDRTGAIAAQPRIVQRGTVGQPSAALDREPFRRIAQLLRPPHRHEQ